MDDARLERLTRIAGGRFRLTSLVQKRMQELIAAAHGFGGPDIDNIFEKVLCEIEEGRVTLELPSGKKREALLGGGDGKR